MYKSPPVPLCKYKNKVQLAFDALCLFDSFILRHKGIYCKWYEIMLSLRGGDYIAGRGNGDNEVFFLCFSRIYSSVVLIMNCVGIKTIFIVKIFVDKNINLIFYF